MASLQISEPNLPLRKRAVGIDLGTTYSLVATVFQTGVKTITDDQGKSLLPSAVYYHTEGLAVGWAALQQALFDPPNTILSIKRLLGRSLTDLHQRYPHLPYQLQGTQRGMPLISTQQGVINPLQVCAEILRVLALRAEQALGGPLEGVVITVPAHFDDAQRQSTKDAARLANLPLLRLLNEPTAAALAYGLQCDGSGVVVVYDLGGGTFDISILRRSADVFEVLATGGNSTLGGDDFDQVLATWLAQQAGWPALLTPALQRELLETAIRVKVILSSQLESTVQLGEWRGVVTRQQFEQLIDPLVQETLMASHQALVDAAVSKQQIDKVVLVGGATRTPLVRRLVASFFECQPLTELDPDQVVAIGAALYADQLIGNPSQQDQLLLDVTPLSLGIETMGGLVQKVIPRNTTIPATYTQIFTTFKNGQNAVMFHVVQGEGERVVDCRSLAQFTLRDLPPMLAGLTRISVTFQVDVDGLLRVTAREQSSGLQASIQVKPSYGLTEQEIHSLIATSTTHRDTHAGSKCCQQY